MIPLYLYHNTANSIYIRKPEVFSNFMIIEGNYFYSGWKKRIPKPLHRPLTPAGPCSLRPWTCVCVGGLIQ